MLGSEQMALFNVSTMAELSAIPGLAYIPDFIDAQTETDLIHIIDQQAWITELKRRVQHYGYRYDYKARNITRDLELGPLPEWLKPYGTRLCAIGLFSSIPDQVIVNEYQPGQGIAPHTDCIPCFGHTVASLSLGSPCVMDFTHDSTGQKFLQLLEPRSLIALSNEARYEWKHAIAPRKTDQYEGRTIERSRRISLTFRTVIMSSDG